jgi:UDP-N-acetylmuramoylalanine--D-glutamate ligase
MEIQGKRVVVVGLGKSGVAAARLCQGRGATVIGTDSAPLERLSDEARALDIEMFAGGHAGVPFETVDLVVVSPGVPALAELDRAERAGVSVIGELELASRFLRAPLLTVGGTNGKSTTTTLLGCLLQSAGLRVFVGGNLGTPAAEACAAEWDAVLYEVSSFQLERAPTLRPKVSILLNVTEDHLDRYPDFAAYARAKGNAFANQGPGDYAIVPAGDAICLEQARRGHGRLVSFGSQADYAIVGDEIRAVDTGDFFPLGDSALHGRHNYENAAAAIAAARSLGAHSGAVRAALRAFRPLPHRMALVGTVGGVPFYDDSKGTNVGAAVTALRGLSEERGVLIAGGRDKLGSYEPLVQALEQKGRAAVLMGEAAERIASAIGGRVPYELASSMDEAVGRAFRLAHPGDAVLLSPACSSFDMFKSYADRGDRFAEAVLRLGASRGEEAQA